MLIQLSYISTANSGLCFNDFEKILKSSNENNAQLGLTGILVYCNMHFFQILEGPKEEVLHKYDEILKDCRHDNVVKLQETEIAARSFNDWEMAFKSYNKELKKLDDLSNHEFYEKVKCDKTEDCYVSRKILMDFFDLNGADLANV